MATNVKETLQLLADVLEANFVHGQHEQEQRAAIRLTEQLLTEYTAQHTINSLNVFYLTQNLVLLKHFQLRNENSDVFWADAVRKTVQTALHVCKSA